MTAIVRTVLRAFSVKNEEYDSALPVLMFTIVGLLLSISFVLAFGLPPFAEFETF